MQCRPSTTSLGGLRLRVLAVDWGGARIGIAVGEAGFGIASPRQAIKATGTLAKDAALIQKLVVQEEANLVVVGIPIHEENARMARVCLQLVERLRELGVEVETMDESLTTELSHRDLADLGYTAAQRKHMVDSESAVRIALRYFAEHG